MTTKVNAIDNGKTGEYGHHRILSRLFDQSGVLFWDELRVKAADTPDNTVKVTVGDCLIGNNEPSASSIKYGGHVTSEESVTIAANASGQGRVDAIVAYIDKSAVVDTDDDNPGVLKFKDVQGTPAGSPTAPTSSDITTSVGAGNPWILLATVVVANGFVTITNANITDQRQLVTTVKRGDWENMGALTRVSDTTASLVGDWTSEIGIGKPLRWKSNGTLRQNWCVGSVFSAVTGLTIISITPGYVTSANDSRFESGETITVPQYSKASSPVGFPFGFATTLVVYKNDGTTVIAPTTLEARLWVNGREAKMTFRINSNTDPLGSPQILLPITPKAYDYERCLGYAYLLLGIEPNNGKVLLAGAGTKASIQADSNGGLGQPWQVESTITWEI